jgi:hypothetical protein
MADRDRAPPNSFRLNLEQQKNRAKDLLRAAKAGDPPALARLAAVGRDSSFKLADAQSAIAHELRFTSWAKLKAHIESLDRQRVAIDRGGAAPDGDMKTLHLRCGSDIQQTLLEAGFTGDFLEHALPYCQGPATRGPDRHELMARFLVDAYPDAHGGLVYERELEALPDGEQRLQRTAEDYERVVMWMEHDSWDQLILARLLSHYAESQRPRVLELITINEFPGGERFRGLGQLPAEALRLLWPGRKPVTSGQLALGHDAWLAITSDDPRDLGALARSGTPALPIMAPALRRHLRELPAVENGLSLTEQLLLQTLSERSRVLGEVMWEMIQGREPLPWITDLGLLHVVNDMLKASEPVLVRTPPEPGRRAFAQRLTITDLGRAVLRGARDWHSLMPPPRWVGGVRIRPGRPGWRWDEAHGEVAYRG